MLLEDLEPGEHRVGEAVITIRDDPPFTIAEVNAPSGSQSLKIRLPHGGKLRLYPILPVHTPERITDHLLFKTREPLALPPESEAAVSLRLSVEVGMAIVGRKGEFQGYVAFFSPRILKYALYGQPTEGRIVRLIDTPVLPPDDHVPPPGELEAGLRARVVNDTGHPVNLARILVDSDYFILYTDSYGSLLTNDLTITVTSDRTAVVTVSRKPPLPGLKSLPQTRYQRLNIIQGLGLQEAKVMMTHGY